MVLESSDADSWHTRALRPLIAGKTRFACALGQRSPRGFCASRHITDSESLHTAEVLDCQSPPSAVKRLGRSGSEAFRLVRAPLLEEPDLQRLPLLAGGFQRHHGGDTRLPPSEDCRPVPPLNALQTLPRLEAATGAGGFQRHHGGDTTEEVHLRRTFPAGILRTGLDENMACHDAEVAEMASQRSSTLRIAQRRGRDRARRWRQAQGRAQTLKSLGAIMQQDGLDASPRPIHSLAPTPEEFEGTSATDAALDLEGQGETRRKHSTLLSTSLRPKQPLPVRLSKVRQLAFERRHPNIAPTISFVRNRAASVFMPVKESYKAEFREVFNYYDEDGDHTLSRVELLHCLRDSGLEGTQRSEVQQILTSKDYNAVTFEDFVKRVVPTVRLRLAELKETDLRGSFAEADVDNSGLLSIRELVREMRILGTLPSDALVLEAVADAAPDIEQSCRSVEGQWIWDREAINVDQFAMIVPLLQERKKRRDVLRFRQISEDFGLSTAQASELRGVLVELHDAFHSLPVVGRGSNEIAKLIQGHGLAPRIPKKTRLGQAALINMTLKDLVGGDLAKAGADFGSLLQLAGRLRRMDSQRLENIFRLYDVNNSHSLSPIEVQHALAECLLVAANRQEADEIQAALSLCNADNSEEIGLEDFVRLCHSLSDRLWSCRRDADRQAAARSGYDLQQFEDFRIAFAELDDNMNGFLDGDEVVSAVEALRRQSSRADTEVLLKIAGVDLGPSTKVTFQQFLQIMKCLDERAACGSNAWSTNRSSMQRSSDPHSPSAQ